MGKLPTKLFLKRKKGAEIENPIKNRMTLNGHCTFSFDARKNLKVSAKSWHHVDKFQSNRSFKKLIWDIEIGGGIKCVKLIMVISESTQIKIG